MLCLTLQAASSRILNRTDQSPTLSFSVSLSLHSLAYIFFSYLLTLSHSLSFFLPPPLSRIIFSFLFLSPSLSHFYPYPMCISFSLSLNHTHTFFYNFMSTFLLLWLEQFRVSRYDDVRQIVEMIFCFK